jgi:hypothetical protein
LIDSRSSQRRFKFDVDHIVWMLRETFEVGEFGGQEGGEVLLEADYGSAHTTYSLMGGSKVGGRRSVWMECGKIDVNVVDFPVSAVQGHWGGISPFSIRDSRSVAIWAFFA